MNGGGQGTDIKVVHRGDTVTLFCEAEQGKELVMSTWKVQRLKEPECTVSFTTITKHRNISNETFNGCSNRLRQDIDTKKITLTIRNSTLSDAGKYTCEIVNENGTLFNIIILQVLVKPSVLIKPTGPMSAECQAIGGHPAATLQWNSSSLHSKVTKTTSIENNNTTTVISTYTLMENNETQTTCAVYHPAFPSPVLLHLTIPGSAEMKILWWVAVPAAVIIVIAITIILFWQRSNLRAICTNKKGIVSDMQENPTVIVEELEPYASFTQKVNSIYNSTSELSEAKGKNMSTDHGIGKIYF
ncbi:cell surface glycoprotein CD200 receptor 1-like isoform X2 [Pyxicephalus adspersus]|uniref:cell surface glycoprotein CD200 receptor 1-like isoform X2 n=1 Tax=Pyxicephalus adspersus TaxID=30357 RepID=UPI003B59B899